MTRLDGLRRGYERALEWLVVVLMAALAGEVTLGVVFRTLGESLVWYDEVASVMLAWLTYYGAALAALKRAHIGFPGLVNAMPSRWRVPAVWFGEACVVTFFALLSWYGLKVLIILQGDTLISLPWVPTRFTQSVIPVGGVLFIVAQLLSLPEVLRQARGGGIVDHEQMPVRSAPQDALS